MGREVRMVPPNWNHPLDPMNGRFRPMFDQTYESARDQWLSGIAAHKPEECDGLDYWEWSGNPPDRGMYRPWNDAEATWVQVWETVTEGTPVTPPFPTREQLVDHLVMNGDDWDQKRGARGWDRKQAEAFVAEGWAPSMMIVGGKLVLPGGVM